LSAKSVERNLKRSPLKLRNVNTIFALESVSISGKVEFKLIEKTDEGYELRVQNKEDSLEFLNHINRIQGI